MQVMGLSPVLQQALIAAIAKPVSGARIALPILPDTAPAPQPSQPLPQMAGAIGCSSIPLLIATAEVERPQERRRRLARNTDKALDLLERLNGAAAAGPVPPALLEELGQWAEQFEMPSEPGLRELARDVELRVRVELARHDMRA